MTPLRQPAGISEMAPSEWLWTSEMAGGSSPVESLQCRSRPAGQIHPCQMLGTAQEKVSLGPIGQPTRMA